MSKAQNKEPTVTEESRIIEILKPFAASEDGCTVCEYSAGLCGGLPPVATKYAIAIGAVSDADAAKLLAAIPESEAAE